MHTYPLICEPIFKHRIWGGRRLAETFGKALPPGIDIGESWELADLETDRSRVANGPARGRTLRAALGKTQTSPLPLLVKFLDAQAALSVQVHPDAATCRRHGYGEPKTECWYIVDAAPGAGIYKGLAPGVRRDEFAAAIAAGTAERLLRHCPVQPGECHFLPAGTVHAIGPGLLIAEIQQPSDTTYRLYDYQRRDAGGQLRELHIEDGLDSIHFDQDPTALPVTTVGRLVDSPYFTVDKRHLEVGSQMLLEADGPTVHLLLAGGGVLTGAFETVPVRAGDCVLLPPACQAVLQCEQPCTWLAVGV